METAKVDLRKLQLLNDRINQCIDALNQVRFSVHGLGHSPASVWPQIGYPQAIGSYPMSYGYPSQSAASMSQTVPFASQTVPFASQTIPFGSQSLPFGGIGHSSYDAVDPRALQTFPNLCSPICNW